MRRLCFPESAPNVGARPQKKSREYSDESAPRAGVERLLDDEFLLTMFSEPPGTKPREGPHVAAQPYESAPSETRAATMREEAGGPAVRAAPTVWRRAPGAAGEPGGAGGRGWAGGSVTGGRAACLGANARRALRRKR